MERRPEEHDSVEQQLDAILRLPQKISNAIHAGLFSKVSSADLKLANFSAAAAPDIKLLIEGLVERLHVDAQIPRAMSARVCNAVRKLFLSCFYDVKDKFVQCMPKVVETAKVPSSARSEVLSQDTQGSQGSLCPTTPRKAPATPAIATTKQYEPYGLVVVNGAYHCLACNKSGLTPTQVVDHIISGSHENRVTATDWQFKLHLAAGFPRRAKYTSDRDAKRKQEHAQKKWTRMQVGWEGRNGIALQ